MSDLNKDGDPGAFPDRLNILKRPHLDSSEIEQWWTLYSEAFAPVAAESPFVQLLGQAGFAEAMADQSILKFTAERKGRPIGIALLSSNILNVPWLSEGYFRRSWAEELESDRLFYLIGLATKPGHSSDLLAIHLIEAAAAHCVALRGAFVFDFAHSAHHNLGGVASMLSTRFDYRVATLDRMTSLCCAPATVLEAKGLLQG
jgi:hypothetical protein